MTRYTFASMLAVLCDTCHAKYERNADTPIGELCKPCRARLVRWTDEMMAEEPDAEDIAMLTAMEEDTSATMLEGDEKTPEAGPNEY
jgi:hypothetical protein